jgi:ribonuclease P protein component
MPALAQVRFGFTVARNHARRAVLRNTVKRVLREAAREAHAPLRRALPAMRVDIVLRLKTSLPDRSAANWSDVKAEVRRQADSLVAQLRRELLARSIGPTQEPVMGPARSST